MNDKIFVDTNVLVYAYDRSEPEKQQKAMQILDALAMSGLGLISTQVLAEFYVAITRKIALPLSSKEAYDRIKNYLHSWFVLDLTGMVVLEAVRGVRDYQLNYWDAQIWATALLNQTPIIFSEDFHAGTEIEGARFVNPFSLDFKLTDWMI